MGIIDDIGEGLEDIGKGAVKFVAGAGDVIVSGGELVVDAVGDVAKAGVNLLGELAGAIAVRPLRPAEKQAALKCFGATSLPLDKVVISSLAGVGGRPFCMPGSLLMLYSWTVPGIGPLLGLSALIGRLTDKYIIFAGKGPYNDAMNWEGKGSWGSKLMHELTHVWQGHNKFWGWNYMINSLANQCSCIAMNESTDRAYAYTLGLHWREYAAEKQAKIVEHWWTSSKGGIFGRDPIRDAYMICNVRPGNKDADTIFPPAASTALKLIAEEKWNNNKIDPNAKVIPHTKVLLPPAPPTPAQIEATAKGLELQAKQLEIQGKAMIASGQPLLQMQGRGYLAQSAALLAHSRALLVSIGKVRMSASSVASSATRITPLR